MLEQPRGSLLQFHPRMQWLQRVLRVCRFEFAMMDFGAPTLKPTWIYCNYQQCGDVRQHFVERRPEPRHMVRRYIDKRGRSVFSGAPDLKRSQKYPRGFGEAVASMYTQHTEHFQRQARELHKAAVRAFSDCGVSDGAVDADDAWEDARLEGVLRLLGV